MFMPHLSTASEEHSYTARTHDCTRTKITRKPLWKKRSLGPSELGLLRTETLHNLLQSILLAHFNSSLTMGFSMKKRAEQETLARENQLFCIWDLSPVQQWLRRLFSKRNLAKGHLDRVGRGIFGTRNLGKRKISWRETGFDCCPGSGTHSNLGSGCGIFFGLLRNRRSH